MPIVEIPKAHAPLTQGDILKDITLFATKEGWLDQGGQPAKAPFKMCLVVSRPCGIAHKRFVTVAGIEKYADDVPKTIDSFDKVAAFLTGARDGIRAPDVLYLGQLPEMAGRYCARLDSLHPIEIPADQTVMEEFLKGKRVATLLPDFARDLHLRLFNAFATLGFDDHSWPSTKDLEWLVNQGHADVSVAEVIVNQLRALKASRTAQGKEFAETELLNAEAKLNGLRQRIAPFEAELARRVGVLTQR
jgi:hypothetical protein